MKESRKNKRITDILEMPKEIVFNIPKITILGFNEMLIENYKGILEYEEFYIKINTYIGVINVNGFNLKLNQMTEEDILIKGKIDSIDFENNTDEE